VYVTQLPSVVRLSLDLSKTVQKGLRLLHSAWGTYLRVLTNQLGGAERRPLDFAPVQEQLELIQVVHDQCGNMLKHLGLAQIALRAGRSDLFEMNVRDFLLFHEALRRKATGASDLTDPLLEGFEEFLEELVRYNEYAQRHQDN
jgi:hypothetical protein